MKLESLNTDTAILKELGSRIARTRIERSLTQQVLANAAAVSKRTIERLELGKSIQTSNLVRVLRALDLIQRLDQMFPEAGPSPIEQLRYRGRERRRASSRKEASPAHWTWTE